MTENGELGTRERPGGPEDIRTIKVEIWDGTAWVKSMGDGKAGILLDINDLEAKEQSKEHDAGWLGSRLILGSPDRSNERKVRIGMRHGALESVDLGDRGEPVVVEVRERDTGKVERYDSRTTAGRV